MNREKNWGDNKRNARVKGKDVKKKMKTKTNKPDRATMRPYCFSACIEHVTYMELENQMNEQTDATTEQ